MLNDNFWRNHLLALAHCRLTARSTFEVDPDLTGRFYYTECTRIVSFRVTLWREWARTNEKVVCQTSCKISTTKGQSVDFLRLSARIALAFRVFLHQVRKVPWPCNSSNFVLIFCIHPLHDQDYRISLLILISITSNLIHSWRPQISPNTPKTRKSSAFTTNSSMKPKC